MRGTRPGSTIAAAAASDPQTSGALLRWSEMLCSRGRYDAALPLLEQALRLTAARHGENAPELLPILGRLDRVYSELGELKRACKGAERALAIAETAFGGNGIELAAPLEALSASYFALGLLDKCYRATERALAIVHAARGDQHVETALARDRLGVVLAEMGDYERARELHLRALAVLRANGRMRDVAATLANLAATYLATGALDAARPLYEEALAIARAQSHDQPDAVALYLALLGDYWAKAGDDARALRDYREALALKRRTVGELHPDVAVLLFKIGRAEYRHDRAAGRQTLLSAIAVLDIRFHRPRLFAEICSFLANELAPSSAAIFFWKLAVNEIEGLRAHVARIDGLLERSFLRQNRDDFRALGDNLIALGRLPEAQHVLAMLKEHELFSLAQIDARHTKVPLTVLEAHWVRRGLRLLWRVHASLERAREEVRRTDRPAASLQPEIVQAGAALDAEFDRLLAEFAADEARPSALVAPRTAESPVNQIPAAGTALLQYLLLPDGSGMSVILTTPDMQREHRIAFAEGEVNRLVYAMREAVQSRSELYLETAQRLHDLLIAPVAAALDAAAVQTLALSLDGVLRYLPMGALHDGKRHLIEKYALVLAPHAAGARRQSLLDCRAAGLGVSHPIGGHQRLSAVRDELAAVIRTGHRHGGVLPGIIRLDRAFTAEALIHALSSQFSVIHVASHFVFATAREPASYLLLGDGSRLTLADFAELRFDAMDLVVLSACNTAIGGGHRQNGHEIEGLGALVRHQGANQVLATLWPVVDHTTAGLMRSFYRSRFTDGVSAPEALRRAQLSLLYGATAFAADDPTRCLIDPDEDVSERPADAHQPFYWAPYILMGALPDREPQ